jgi:DNA-binding NarL/FixJ family response regulator
MIRAIQNNRAENPKLRLLLVDRSPTVLQALQEEIQQADWVEIIAQALTSQSAIALFFELKPDAVIVSTCLSDLGGLEVLRCIRRAFAHCPVILTIRHFDPFVTEAAQLLGATAVCCISERPTRLVHILKRLEFQHPDTMK